MADPLGAYLDLAYEMSSLMGVLDQLIEKLDERIGPEGAIMIPPEVIRRFLWDSRCRLDDVLDQSWAEAFDYLRPFSKSTEIPTAITLTRKWPRAKRAPEPLTSETNPKKEKVS